MLNALVLDSRKFDRFRFRLDFKGHQNLLEIVTRRDEQARYDRPSPDIEARKLARVAEASQPSNLKDWPLTADERPSLGLAKFLLSHARS